MIPGIVEFADRISEAGLNTTRFIDVQNGGKGTDDHTQHEPGGVDGNCGVYAGTGKGGGPWLVIFDVDDYAAQAESDGLRKVNALPNTLTVKTPHTDGETGGHRYYWIQGENIAQRIEQAIESMNPSPSWGEIQVKNQYVVGPGSQLDGCNKEWCSDCASPDGGWYEIAKKIPVAEIDLSDIFDVLEADGYELNGASESGETVQDTAEPSIPNSGGHCDLTVEELKDLGMDSGSNVPFGQLWRGEISHYDDDHSDARMAFYGEMAFFTREDSEAMWDVFTESGLYPHPTKESGTCERLREREIGKAIMNNEGVYNGADMTAKSTGSGPRLPADGGRLIVADGPYEAVAAVLEDLGTASNTEIASHRLVDINERQVRRALDFLEDEGRVEWERPGASVIYELTDDQ